ncbi:MAG: hypothetical protein INR71_11575 [Terriglobus roseus]|nr:hypothetical protein [Terriglobus roseus]
MSTIAQCTDAGANQVADNWEEEDDSEAEREKAKKAAEAKEKADAEAAANKKTKAQRIEEHRNERLRRLQEEDGEESDEDEAERLRRAKEQEKAGDLKHAEDLFGDLSVGSKRSGAGKPVVTADPADPNNNIDLSTLPVFRPLTKTQFAQLKDTLVPLVAANAKKGQYALFLQDLCRGFCADLPSNEVKKLASVLTTLSNEKMKEEKAAEKGGKKTKAQQTKTTLKAGRDISNKADTTAYDDGLSE